MPLYRSIGINSFLAPTPTLSHVADYGLQVLESLTERGEILHINDQLAELANIIIMEA